MTSLCFATLFRFALCFAFQALERPEKGINKVLGASYDEAYVVSLQAKRVLLLQLVIELLHIGFADVLVVVRHLVNLDVAVVADLPEVLFNVQVDLHVLQDAEPGHFDESPEAVGTQK